MCEFADIAEEDLDGKDVSLDIDILADDEVSPEAELEQRVEEMDISEEIKSIVDQNMQSLTLPKSNGEWAGDRGNSEFVIDDDYIPSGRGVNPDGLTMAEILKEYDIDGVTYHNKEPDFSPFVDAEIGAVELDAFSDKRIGEGGTYALAREKAAENLGVSAEEVDRIMDERGLTWHECSDRKTVLPIPTDINAAFKHSGGISIEKSVNDLGQYLHSKFGNLVLERTPPLEGALETDLDIDAAHKAIRKDIRNNRSK